MVLMSLVKSPMARSPFVLGTPSDLPPCLLDVRLRSLANRPAATLFLGITKTSDGTCGTDPENVKTRILETSPYVGFMTGTPSTAEAAIVKDCTRPRFCLKELPHRERLTAASPMVSTGFQT